MSKALLQDTRNIKNIGSILFFKKKYLEDVEEFQKDIAKESENCNSEQQVIYIYTKMISNDLLFRLNNCKSIRKKKIQYIECVERGKGIGLDYEELERCLTVNTLQWLRV